ncbi:MAG: DUF2269 domain-containing protein [Alphaproteobacteria bacterium]|uniref:DUF2269 domain-containing protein n=1 Tax=Candidatus Nitrobium versatile TaxID=2884831 RepID=A0A953M3D7_9BACT|nr:DUF2269 domain-containing protein [Candidatus Nitrobium versatile]
MHVSSKWVIGELIGAVLAAVLLRAYHYPLLVSYQWHKLLHIAGAVLFLGNIVVTGVWMFMAGCTRSNPVLRFASRAVNWADAFFTVPGVFLVFVNGDILSVRWGGVFRTGWIAVSLVLFAVSGVIWGGFLLRYQHRLIVLSERQQAAEFFLVLRRWYALGILATVIPFLALALMVLKPRF